MTSDAVASHQTVTEASLQVSEFFREGWPNIGATPFLLGKQWKPDESVSTPCVVCTAALIIPFSKKYFFQGEALSTVIEHK